MATAWDSASPKNKHHLSAKMYLEDWQSRFATIQEANRHLLETGKFSDITFSVGEDAKRIHGHRFILMARSSVFETMLERWTPTDSDIVLPDTTFTAFSCFLKFLYTDEFCVEIEDAVEVTYLAHKYNVVSLMGKCSAFLQSVLNPENAIQIYQAAEMFQQEDLKEYAFEFITRNGITVLKAVSVDTFIDTLTTILKSNKLDADEMSVFQAVIGWAELVCNEMGLLPTPENKRFVSIDLIPLIRFPLMSLETLNQEVITKNPGFLSDAEIAELLAYMNTEKGQRSALVNFEKKLRFVSRPHSVLICYEDMNELSGSNFQSNARSGLEFIVNMDIWIHSLVLNQDHFNFHFLRDMNTRMNKSENSVDSFVNIYRVPTGSKKCSSTDVDSVNLKITALDLDPVVIHFDFPVMIQRGERYKIVTNKNSINNCNSDEIVLKTGKFNIPVNTSKTKRSICSFGFSFASPARIETKMMGGVVSKINFSLK